MSACSGLFCRLLFACHPLPAMPTALNVLAPVQLLQVCLPPFSHLLCLLAPVQPCAPGSPFSRAGGLFPVRASSLFHRCKSTNLQAARLSRWQLQHGPAVAARAPVHLTHLFPAESMILGHGGSVEFVSKMCVVNTCASPGMSYVLGRQCS